MSTRMAAKTAQVKSYRRGIEDASVAAFAAVQEDANDRGIQGGGPSVATVYVVATDHGLDGARPGPVEVRHLPRRARPGTADPP